MLKEIYLAGGCFWGTQHYMRQIRGVCATEVGYANGEGEQPTYEEVYTDRTGFAETVKVIYDAEQAPLTCLLGLYFRSIDAESLNRQGNDAGTRYRTGIYYTDEADLPIIREAYRLEEARHERPLVVEVEPLAAFYAAEEYHQDYLEKNPMGYCHISPELIRMAREANR
ncbi:MAG: peptide-methionine (S)-S-oxide reductase MsrA [Alistipes sp.]|nr:peptide-methionine (S)-S-oxide reductase MsrA [Alistipes sp.]